MRRMTQESLIRAWHGSDARGDIAESHRLASVTVKKFWAACRADGRLPDRHRPFFPPTDCVPSVAPDCDTDANADLELDADMARAEQNYSAERNAHACAESLAAMRKAHPALDNPNAQIAPASWFKRNAPTPDELMAMARDLDRASRAARVVRA